MFTAVLYTRPSGLTGFIIDYLKDFVLYRKSKRIIYKNQEYIWLNYNHLIASLPFIKLQSKSAISKRIKRIERLGLIKTCRAKDKTLYYTFTDKLIDICFTRKKDMERIQKAKLTALNNQSYPQLKDPVLAKRTAQYNTKISIINKDNNNDISFSSSLKTKTVKPRISTDEYRLELNTENTESTERKNSAVSAFSAVKELKPRICTDENRNPNNPIRKEVKGFKTMSSVWQVVENIKQRQINHKIGTRFSQDEFTNARANPVKSGGSNDEENP